MDVTNVDVQKREEVVNPRTIGEIVHAAYGISFTGAPSQPLTFEQLQERGWSKKEIVFSLKAAEITKGIRKLADTITGDQFMPTTVTGEDYGGEYTEYFRTPKDLLKSDKSINPVLLKTYVGGLVDRATTDVFLNETKMKYPNVYTILCTKGGIFGTSIPEGREADLFAASEFGIDYINAMYTFIAKRVPPERVAPVLARSLPTLYRLASQNIDTKGSPDNLMLGLEDAYSPEEERTMRMELAESLMALPEEELVHMKKKLLGHLLGSCVNVNAGDAYLAVLEQFEKEIHESKPENTRNFALYVAGLKESPVDATVSEPVRRFYAEGIKQQYSWILDWRKDTDKPLPQRLSQAIHVLDQGLRVNTLNPDFFEMAGEQDTLRVKLKEEEPQPGRTEKALLLKLDVDLRGEKMPADIAKPYGKTVRCSAMHARLTSEQVERLLPVMNTLNFHPAELNGISFPALLMVMAAEQAREASTTVDRMQPVFA